MHEAIELTQLLLDSFSFFCWKSSKDLCMYKPDHLYSGNQANCRI